MSKPEAAPEKNIDHLLQLQLLSLFRDEPRSEAGSHLPASHRLQVGMFPTMTLSCDWALAKQGYLL